MIYTDYTTRSDIGMAKAAAVSVRLPEELDAWIRENAKKETRSLSGEIIHQLKIAKALADAKAKPA